MNDEPKALIREELLDGWEWIIFRQCHCLDYSALTHCPNTTDVPALDGNALARLTVPSCRTWALSRRIEAAVSHLEEQYAGDERGAGKNWASNGPTVESEPKPEQEHHKYKLEQKAERA